MGGPPIFSQRSSRERRLNDVRAELYLREFAGSNPSELCRKKFDRSFSQSFDSYLIKTPAKMVVVNWLILCSKFTKNRLSAGLARTL